MAVAHADYILELQAGLDRDEMPPAWMWPFTKRMNEHLDGVQAARKDKFEKPADREDDTMRDNLLLPRRRG